MKFDPRLLRLAYSSRFALTITILCGFVGGILTVLQARLFSQVIGGVFLRGQAVEEVAGLLGLLLGSIVLRAALTWGGEVSANSIALRVKTGLRSRLFAHILQLGPSYAGGERTGELVNSAVEGVEALDAYFSQYLPQLILAALVPVTFLVLIFPLDPLSAAVLLVTAPLIPIFMILIGNLAEALTRRQWRSLSRLSAHFLDVLQGLTTLKILGRSRAQGKAVQQAGESYRQATMGVLRVAFLSALALELISTLGTAVVAVEIGLRLLYGRLSFEGAFFVLLLAPEFYLPLRSLGTRFHAGMAGVAAAGRIFEVLETTKDEGRTTKDESVLLSSFVVRPSSSLVPILFNNVHYTYPDGRRALKDVSFELQPGQRIALVGPSGAGKSTITALLLRFIEPNAGEIMAGRSLLKDVSPESWRQMVAWVPQHAYLFHDTLEANIRLARPEAGREEVVEASRLAGLHEFVEGLPQGYGTVIGERGARLSGGQAQRIALARAFLKNAPVLILDEATANLDPELEDEIQASLARLAASRTVLTIAHRLNTCLQADQILVLEDGCLLEAGTHAELIERDGVYNRLWGSYRGDLSLIPVPGGFYRHSPAGRGESYLVSYNQKPSPSNIGGEYTKTIGQTSSQSLPNTPAPLLPRTSAPLHPCSPAQTLWRLIQIAAPYKGLIALSVVLGFATIGSGIGLMTTSAYIIARAALQPSIAELQVAIVGVRFFGIARGLFRYLERCVSHEVTFRLLTRLRTWFYTSLEPLAPARLASFQSGDLLSRAVGDIAFLENFYVRALAPPLVAVIVAMVMATFMTGFSPALAASLAALLLLAGLGVPVLTFYLGREAGRRMPKERAALNASLVDGIQGLADLLAFGQGSRQLEKVQVISRRLADCQAQMARTGGLNSALGILLSNLGMWVTVILSIPLVRSGQIEGVLLPVLTLAALASFEAVLPLPAAAQHLEGSLEAARRLFELVDVEPEVRDPEHPLALPDWREVRAPEIPEEAGAAGRVVHPFDLEIRDLSFQYPGMVAISPSHPAPLPEGEGRLSPAPLLPCSPALSDLTLSLPFGSRVAIVGPSGAGKSTLVHLLLRFWEYQEGEILLGGRDIRWYAQQEVRKNLAVVSQNTYLFNATVRENLLLARPKATEAEIVQAARTAQIHEFLLGLPDGYDTWIGEQGLRLSGGERQRLAIARAVLKDAPILILDEPTANLDLVTEREVLAALLPLMEGRTTLMITHRLAGLECMDEILVLREGRLVERGRYADLLEMGGNFRRMWELQNQVLERSNRF